MRYFIRLAFCGTNYKGWQKQPNAQTVQGVLNEKISLVLRHKVDLTGAGRTDTGVHASIYYAHFDTPEPLDNTNSLVYKLNRILPEDIVIYDIFKVADSAHARFDAVSRTYHYFIETRKNPFTNRFMTYYHRKTDFELMNKAAEFLLSLDDFKSFCKSGSNNKTTLCKVSEAKWIKTDDTQYVFKITADRFLRNMVRAIVGTLFEVGEKKINLDQFYNITHLRNRTYAGESIPPQGLFLSNIIYPYVKENNIDNVKQHKDI